MGEPEYAKFFLRPQNYVPVDAEKGATLLKLIGILEEDDDVQNVYSNFDMSDEDLAKASAEGQAAAIRAVAAATAEGLREVAGAIRTDGGMEAVQLRVAEQYVTQFGHIAQKTNTVVIPANLSDVAGMIAAAMKVFSASGTPQR